MSASNFLLAVTVAILQNCHVFLNFFTAPPSVQKVGPVLVALMPQGSSSKKIVIVGPKGAGKSALTSYLSEKFDPDEERRKKAS